MKQNRTLHFGYAIRQGRPTVLPREAEVVRGIFRAYAAGASYLQLANGLSGGDVPYHAGTPAWNKHMIKRILENERYLGTDELPVIVTPAEFEAARRVRLGKTEGYAGRPAHTAWLRSLLRCAVCGSRLHRDTRSNHTRWTCGEHSGEHPLVVVREDRLLADIGQMLTELTEDVGRVEIPATEFNGTDAESIRLANELRRETERPGCDEGQILGLILAAAAGRYARCDDGRGAIQAQRIRERLRAAHKKTGPDLDLLSDIAKAVHLHPGGVVELELLTGQRVGGRDAVGTENAHERTDAP